MPAGSFFIKKVTDRTGLTNYTIPGTATA